MVQMNKMTTKEKLDSALGISDGSSFDELLDTLTVDTATTAMEKVADNVKETVKDLDKNISNCLSGNYSITSLNDIGTYLDGINELINIAKTILTHLYKNIITTDVTLVDPELINATSTFITSCRDSIKEWIDLYRDRAKFLDKIQLQLLEHQHKKDLLKYKFELEAEFNNSQTKTPENMKIYRQEDLVKLIDSIDN